MARCLAMTGATSQDVFQNMSGYGMFTGGLGLHYGAERLGMLVIPAGPGQTARQIMLIRDFGVTCIHSTPSYFTHVAAKRCPSSAIAPATSPASFPASAYAAESTPGSWAGPMTCSSSAG